MDQVEFDRFADEYYDQHRENVAVTGESPEYFAEYKIKKLKQIVDRSNISVSRICDFGSGIGNSIPFFSNAFSRCFAHIIGRLRTQPGAQQTALSGIGQLSSHRKGSHPSEPDAFDVVFSACVFHHIAHDEHAMWLRELHRITRPGGLIAVFEHNPLNPLTVRAVNTCPFDVNAKLIFARNLARRLGDAGWVSPRIQYNLFFPRGLSSLRPMETNLSWLPLGAQYVAFARKP